MDLAFDHVTKFYGPVIGVNEIDCRIGPGITALFGANGAGKSTLMRLAAGQLRPSLGEVRVGPRRSWSARAKRDLGYSPDLDRFYAGMSGREFVFTMARLNGFGRREAKRRTEGVLAQVGMTDRAHRRIDGYSRGMRQRIKLAQAMVHDPSVLLLDEPLDGIDPSGRRELGQIFSALAQSGKTVLVSTHILHEVERLAGQVLVIARGRVAAQGTLAEIRSLLDERATLVEIEAEPVRLLAARLAERPEVESLEVRKQTLRIATRQANKLFDHVRDLAADGLVRVERLEIIDAGADAVFDYLQQEVS
jgi:ABC-2 type transport system ATP-binding protein